MLTILLFIVLLGALIFVHELGHFLAAKINGIKSEEFGFGFPPRLAGVYRDAAGKWRLVVGNRAVSAPDTVYSLNWIPLGGFVRIKGEDEAEGAADADSFGNKPARVRIFVMAAGVLMNLAFAWVLFSIVLMLGIPQAVSSEDAGKHEEVRIQIVEVTPESPAAQMGLQPADIIVALGGEPVRTLEEVGEFVAAHRGEPITVTVDRFGKTTELTGTPNLETAEGEGALGIGYTQTAMVAYPWYEAIYRGALATYSVTLAIFEAFGRMLAGLLGIGAAAPVDVTGPVGIVYLTKQMSDLGLAYLLQFAGLLSINLAIINILPIPALDGGRILFVLIEKLKGSPVSRRVEGMIHQVGFALLLLLMLLVTLRDFATFNLLDKLGGLF